MNVLKPGPTAHATVLLAVFMVAAGAHTAHAQELDCTVSVNIQQLTGTDYGFLNELQQRVDEYLNHRRWTEHEYLEFERIACQIQINFEEALSLTSFRASLVVATRRPIYGTLQSTSVVQFRDDDWQFSFSQGTPLSQDQERYDPITSLLSFYAYLILGYDYDTFSELGGTAYFQQARRIAERAQAQNAPGWSQVGNTRGRLELVTNLLDPAFRPLRRAYYQYHFEALDRFARDAEAARQTIYTTLEGLQQLYEQEGRSYALDLFFNAKYTELTAVFRQSRMSNQALGLLGLIDSAHLSEYSKITQ